MKTQQFTVGDIIRMPNYEGCGGYRCWKIIGIHLGAIKQEGTYNLLPLDLATNENVHVPCVMLELHPLVARI